MFYYMLCSYAHNDRIADNKLNTLFLNTVLNTVASYITCIISTNDLKLKPQHQEGVDNRESNYQKLLLGYGKIQNVILTMINPCCFSKTLQVYKTNDMSG